MLSMNYNIDQSQPSPLDDERLQQAVFEIIKEMPDVAHADLLYELNERVPGLLVELFGEVTSLDDCYEINERILELWEETYEDPVTEYAMSFSEWKDYFMQGADDYPLVKLHNTMSELYQKFVTLQSMYDDEHNYAQRCREENERFADIINSHPELAMFYADAFERGRRAIF